ncbi:MAG: hypothetical protein RMJ98_11995 [Myxococcales bacterium]|nr:hypothetical protein [Polyangiaceae bacterium]MDW8250008.1 hypothetical protein [Myxococcales bacterium]
MILHRSLLVLCLTTLVSPVQADETSELMMQATQAEQSLDFAAAEAAYTKILELRPSGSFAHRARIRLEHLRAHAEGGYAPLKHLEEVRRVPRLASDPEALAALFEEAQRFPPGKVRTEALLLVAEGFGQRLRRSEQALAPASMLLRDPQVDRPLRAHALKLMVEAHLALGQKAQAAAVVAEFPGLAPVLERRLAVDRRRHLLFNASIGCLAVLGAILVVSLGKLRGRLWFLRRIFLSATSLSTVALLGSVGSWLTYWYDESLSLRPFWLLGAGVWMVDRSVAVGREAVGRTKGARMVLGGLGVLGVLAVAFLALFLSDPLYLESFGL